MSSDTYEPRVLIHKGVPVVTIHKNWCGLDIDHKGECSPETGEGFTIYRDDKPIADHVGIMDGPRYDRVNHPPHYTQHPSGVECITITEHMGFNLGNAVKYISRADKKGNALEDLMKAEFYIKREIARRSQ